MLEYLFGYFFIVCVSELVKVLLFIGRWVGFYIKF